MENGDKPRIGFRENWNRKPELYFPIFYIFPEFTGNHGFSHE